LVSLKVGKTEKTLITHPAHLLLVKSWFSLGEWENDWKRNYR
jgi:hypothetical protein